MWNAQNGMFNTEGHAEEEQQCHKCGNTVIKWRSTILKIELNFCPACHHALLM